MIASKGMAKSIFLTEKNGSSGQLFKTSFNYRPLNTGATAMPLSRESTILRSAYSSSFLACHYRSNYMLWSWIFCSVPISNNTVSLLPRTMKIFGVCFCLIAFSANALTNSEHDTIPELKNTEKAFFHVNRKRDELFYELIAPVIWKTA